MSCLIVLEHSIGFCCFELYITFEFVYYFSGEIFTTLNNVKGFIFLEIVNDTKKKPTKNSKRQNCAFIYSSIKIVNLLSFFYS